jgi:adenylate kinase family enzyme
MKIVVFGGSGSGTTTLGKSLSQHLNWKHLDSDDYYWKPTNPPYQVKFSVKERHSNLERDFNALENVVLTGSMATWGEHWKSAFDLAIFLKIPHKLRMKRLWLREIERYGDALKTDPIIIETSKEFLDWAAQYDDPTFDGKSITQHRNWIKALTCPTLELDGDFTNEYRIQEVLKYIQNTNRA